MDQEEISKIKEAVGEFFQKMAVSPDLVEVLAPAGGPVEVRVQVKEPQLLIGQNGQTLLELQRVLKMLIGRKINQALYVRLDINSYQKEKVEHLKSMALTAADEVAITGQRK